MDAPADDAQIRRIIVLEERLMHQQQLVDQLNGVLLQQNDRLDQLTRELARIRAELARLADVASGENLPHEKPPHY